MQVLKQEVKDDRQHKGYVLCEEIAMNGFHSLHRYEKSYKAIMVESVHGQYLEK